MVVMKGAVVVLVAFVALVSAIPRHAFYNAFPKAAAISDSVLVSSPTEPTRHVNLVTTDEFPAQLLNKSALLDKRVEEDEFSCAGVEYFAPDIEVECLVHKRTTKASWFYNVEVKIKPTGLAYGYSGLGRWYDHFLKKFLDGWDSDVFGDAVSNPESWQQTWKHKAWEENNWGIGLQVISTDMDLDRDGDDPGLEKDLAGHLIKIIPKAVCGDKAGSLSWYHEKEKCMIESKDVTGEGHGDAEDEDKEDKKKKEEEDKKKKKEEEDKKKKKEDERRKKKEGDYRPPRPFGGYHGRDG